MTWQDPTLAVIQLAFAGALLPAVLGRTKPDRWTCTLTATLLYALAGVLATLDLRWGAGTSALVAALWTALLMQRRPGR